MEIALWILQAVLAVVMLAAGSMKLLRSKEQLLASGNMDWTEDFTPQALKGIGSLEVLAAIGLIVPAAIDVAPVLTALAAGGIVLLMLGAAATHFRRGEKNVVPVNVALGALALFVAIERLGPNAF